VFRNQWTDNFSFIAKSRVLWSGLQWQGTQEQVQGVLVGNVIDKQNLKQSSEKVTKIKNMKLNSTKAPLTS